MRTVFQISADLEVVVEAEIPMRKVNLTVFRGVCHDHPRGEPCKDKTVENLALQKSHARSIASAIMGAAAEI